MQPGRELAFQAASMHCRLPSTFWSTRTPKTFSTPKPWERFPFQTSQSWSLSHGLLASHRLFLYTWEDIAQRQLEQTNPLRATKTNKQLALLTVSANFRSPFERQKLRLTENRTLAHHDRVSGQVVRACSHSSRNQHLTFEPACQYCLPAVSLLIIGHVANPMHKSKSRNLNWLTKHRP